MDANSVSSPKIVAVKATAEINQIRSPKLLSPMRSNVPCRLTNNRIMMPSKSTVKVVLPVRDIGELSVVTYEHDIFVGNGGSIRFFLLGKQVRHRFINVPLDEENPIPSFIDSSRVPLGDLPIIKLGDLVLFDEIPCLRYLAKKLGEYGRNYYIDFVIDDIILRCSRWRDVIMEIISKGAAIVPNKNSVQDHINSLSNYKVLREKFYSEFETLITCIGERGPFIADKNKAMICDFALFSILFDDVSLMEINEHDQLNRTVLLPENCIIHKFPRLKLLFESIAALPLIDQWIKGKYFIIEVENDNNDQVNLLTSNLLQESNQSLINGYNNAFVNYPPMLRFQPFPFQHGNQIFAQANAGVRFFSPSTMPTNNYPIIPSSNSFISHSFVNYHPHLWSNQFMGNYCSSGFSSPVQQKMSPAQSFKLNF